MSTNGFPSNHIKKQIEKYKSIRLLRNVSKLYNTTNWHNISNNVTQRRFLCLECIDIDCIHINNYIQYENFDFLDRLGSNCPHNKNTDLCFECIENELKNTILSESNFENIYIIWDSKDLSTYGSWFLENSLNYGNFN